MQRNTLERLARIGAALGVNTTVYPIGVCGVGATHFLDACDRLAKIDTTGGKPKIKVPNSHGYANRVGKRIMLHEIHLGYEVAPSHYFWLGEQAEAA